jgi:DNA polymerase (family 10)
LSESQVLAQLAEIDRLNASPGIGIRILKGIEADILSDGRLDYGPEILDRFDFVIGAVHSRFAMSRDEMTARILRALDEPQLTILGHPTGRRLLSRGPYLVDIDAVLEGAAARGVAIELNTDPRRLDLDWRYFSRARELGVQIVIGPDAHSARGFDTIDIGVGMARKGWLESDDVLNTRSVDGVLAFARARRAS